MTNYNLNESVIHANSKRVGKIVDVQEVDGKTYYKVDFDGLRETMSEHDLAYFLAE
jgi:rRNA processing protein Gar1